MNYPSSLSLHMKLTSTGGTAAATPTPENGLFAPKRNLKPLKTDPMIKPATTSSRSFVARVSDNKGQGTDPHPNPNPNPNPDGFAKLQIQQVYERQSKLQSKMADADGSLIPTMETPLLKQAYETCRQICADRSTTYYLGSLLMTEQKKKAVWAVYAWGQRTDELVDFANSNLEASAALDKWEKRLDDIFHGQPHDIADTALADTFQRFPLDIKPFKDLIEGMRMDTWKSRYSNYEELELYCYYVAATGCLMAIPIAGIAPEHASSTQSIYEAALSLGIANQLTNILRDVGEDASRGRIYLPQDELREFGLTDEDIFSKNVTDKWREFTKMQIARARQYYNVGGQVAAKLNTDSRWPVWSSLILYQKILDKIEENNYDNLTKRARVSNAKKILTLPLAYAKSMGW